MYTHICTSIWKKKHFFRLLIRLRKTYLPIYLSNNHLSFEYLNVLFHYIILDHLHMIFIPSYLFFQKSYGLFQIIINFNSCLPRGFQVFKQIFFDSSNNKPDFFLFLFHDIKYSLKNLCLKIIVA